MARDYTICLGTIGSGIWRSEDAGDTWSSVRQGIWNDSSVYALTPDPTDAATIYAGAHNGLYRSRDRGASFERLESPLNDYVVWSIAVDPTDRGTLFTGCEPSALFRSRDGGGRWEKLTVDMAEKCANVRLPRVTRMAVDPTDNRIIWAGVEVDGVRRSLDGGDTWTTIGAAVNPGTTGEELHDPDIHDIVVSAGSPTTTLTSTPREIFASTDVGESWQPLGVKDQFSMLYCRPLALKQDDPKVIFLGNGEGPFGTTGSVERSRDRGDSWETLPLPIEPNSPIWNFAVNPADPNLVLCCSHYGQIFCSEDAGDSWRKIRREFGEIWTMVWLPS